MAAVDVQFVAALAPVVDALIALGVRYYVTGSVVSSRYGMPRATADVDLVAELAMEHAVSFEERLHDAYYVDRESVEDAIRRRSMFNVVHNETMIKVDVYAVSSVFDRATLARATPLAFTDEPQARPFMLAPAEDVVLHKLRWFQLGGQVSERQWNDVVGVLRVQSGQLDESYLRTWAVALGVEELFERARRDATTP